MAGGYMGWNGPASGNGDYLQQLLNAQRAGIPFSNTDGYLQQVMSQPTAAPASEPRPIDGQPITPTNLPPAQGATPAASPTATGGGGGGDLNSLLQEILADARSNKYMESIQSAYDLQSKQAAEAAGLQTTDDLASRGMLPRDNQSRDLRARLVGQAMAPIAANRAAAIADAQAMQSQRLSSVANLMADIQGREETRRRQEAQDAEQRRQFDATMAYNNAQAAYRQSQDAQRLQDTMSGGGGGGPQPFPTPEATGGGGPAAGPSFFDLISGQNYSINGQSLNPQGGGSGGQGYAAPGGGGTNFLPTLDGGSTAGLWSDGRGGTTWHNPNNAPRPFQAPAPANQSPANNQAATSFSGVASGGGATSFAKPPGSGGTVAGTAPAGGQVMGGSQQVGFGGGPANSPSFNTPTGFAGYGQSWNTPQLAGQAAGVRTGRADDIFNAATGRYA